MRLVLITAEDEELTVRMESDPELMKHLNGPRPVDEIRAVHKRRLEGIAAGTAAMYKILPDDSDDVMGTIGIWEMEHEGKPIHEMGWIVLEAYQGRGVATEAGKLILDQARGDPRVNVVHAFPGADNPASNAICQKLGFEFVGEVGVEFNGLPLRTNNWRLKLREPAN